MRIKYFSLLLCAFLLSGCASASSQRRDVQNDKGDRLTVGTVQKNITIGMSSAQVAEVLGAPNIVSTDENRLEVWVYDKIATDVTYSQSDAGIRFLTIGNAGSASTNQRTLTVVIKFDKDGKVRDFAYHTSSF